MGLFDSWWNIVLTGLFAVIVLLYDWTKNKLSYFRRNQIKHVKFNLTDIVKQIIQGTWPEGNINNFYNEYTEEKYVGYYRGVLPSFIIRDPALVDDITGRASHHFLDRWRYSSIHYSNPMSANLYFMSGSIWQSLRDDLSPGLSLSTIVNMFPAMQSSANSICQQIRSSSTTEEYTKVNELFPSYNLSVLGKTSGVELNSDVLNNLKSYVCKKLKNVSTESLKTILLRLKLEIKFLWNILRKADMKVEKFVDIFRIEVDKKRYEKAYKNNFIQLLKQIKDKNSNECINKDKSQVITDEILSSQLMMFCQSSLESCSSILSLTCYHLSVNRHHQDKVRRELRRAKQNFRVINYDALKEMTFLDRCIKETLRLNPLTPLLMRACTKDYIMDQDVTIKKGQTVCIPVMCLQKDSKYWTNPHLFDPDRFIRDQNICGAYLPFGQGSRMCLGKDLALLQVKTLLAKLIENFEIYSNSEPEEILISDTCYHQHSVDGVRLRFKPLDLITQLLEEGRKPLSVFLDFCKAFDSGLTLGF